MSAKEESKKEVYWMNLPSQLMTKEMIIKGQWNKDDVIVIKPEEASLLVNALLRKGFNKALKEVRKNLTFSERMDNAEVILDVVNWIDKELEKVSKK